MEIKQKLLDILLSICGQHICCRSDQFRRNSTDFRKANSNIALNLSKQFIEILEVRCGQIVTIGCNQAVQGRNLGIELIQHGLIFVSKLDQDLFDQTISGRTIVNRGCTLIVCIAVGAGIVLVGSLGVGNARVIFSRNFIV